MTRACKLKKEIVKLRSRSRSGEGQEGQSQAKSSSENSKLKDLDLSYTINFTTTTLHTNFFFLGTSGSTSKNLFSWLLRGLDKSDRLRMGWYWYDSSIVRRG